jgi:hypothetical protein
VIGQEVGSVYLVVGGGRLDLETALGKNPCAAGGKVVIHLYGPRVDPCGLECRHDAPADTIGPHPRYEVDVPSRSRKVRGYVQSGTGNDLFPGIDVDQRLTENNGAPGTS